LNWSQRSILKALLEKTEEMFATAQAAGGETDLTDDANLFLSEVLSLKKKYEQVSLCVPLCLVVL
jgi:hypothetical protein